MAAVPVIDVVMPARDEAPTVVANVAAALGCRHVREVIVVDDGSRDDGAVAAVVARVLRDARIVRGAGDGPAAARNRGVRAASGDVICFTDDDCAPVPGWAAALARSIAEGAAASAGPTREAAHSPAATAAQAITSHLTEGSLDPSTGRLAFAPTCNLACRTDVLLGLPFDERYPLAAGEDRDWCARLLAAGHTLVYAPGAVVDHHQELSMAAFWRRQVRYGRGAYRLHRAGGPGLAHPRFYAGLVRRGFASGPAVGILVCAAQVATAIGMALAARERRADPVRARSRHDRRITPADRG